MLRSKTAATWIAALGGGFGLHRFYLHGLRDVPGWLLLPPTLVGWYGVYRARTLGVDDQLAWALVPVLGFVLAGTMLTAIVYGLMPDERWDARYNAGRTSSPSGWLAVLGVIFSLAVGATILMATIAYGGQHYFEYQIEEAKEISR
jgi:hypothetical protein